MDTFDPKHIYSDAAKLARLKDKKLFLFLSLIHISEPTRH